MFFDRRRLKKQARVIFVILVIVLSAGLIMSSMQWASAPAPVVNNSQDVSQAEMQKALKEQVAKLEKEVKEKPTDITLMSQLAYMYQMSGEIEKGKKFFNGQIDVLAKLSKDKPKDVDTLLALATSYDIIGDNEKALASYTKVIELKPDSYDVRLRLASQHFHDAKFDQAEEQVKYVVDKQPDNSRAINMYAYVLAAKEDYKGAIEQQEKFLTLEKEGQAVDQAKKDLEEWKKQIKE